MTTMMPVTLHAQMQAGGLTLHTKIPTTFLALRSHMAGLIGPDGVDENTIEFANIQFTDDCINDRLGWQHARRVQLNNIDICMIDLEDLSQLELPQGAVHVCGHEVTAKFECETCGKIAVAKVPKLIALDYDGTITSDIEFWIDFITRAQARGHQIVIATMRHVHEKQSMDDRILDLCPWIVTTGRWAKLPFLHGVKIVPDIWIDDNPHLLFNDADG